MFFSPISWGGTSQTRYTRPYTPNRPKHAGRTVGRNPRTIPPGVLTYLSSLVVGVAVGEHLVEVLHAVVCRSVEVRLQALLDRSHVHRVIYDLVIILRSKRKDGSLSRKGHYLAGRGSKTVDPWFPLTPKRTFLRSKTVTQAQNDMNLMFLPSSPTWSQYISLPLTGQLQNEE